MRCSANDHVSRIRRAGAALGPMSSASMSSASMSSAQHRPDRCGQCLGPVPSLAPRSCGAALDLPRSLWDSALQKEIVHRRPSRATNPASAGCGFACSEVAIAHLGAAHGVRAVESCPGPKQGPIAGLDRQAEARSLRRLDVADQGRDGSRSRRSTARVERDDRLRAAVDQSSPALRIALTVGGITAVSRAVSDTASRVFSPSPVL